MPRTCCVPGCKSNYNSTLNSGGTLISSFGFPIDEILKNKWLKAIPRELPNKSCANLRTIRNLSVR
nr:unnamed protein product [Callosobruchus chinensis]